MNTSEIALVVAIASILLSMYTAYLQRKHDILSVRPLGYIILLNYETNIGVKIVNYGVGPMNIIDLKVEDSNHNTTDTLIEYIENKMTGETWSDFVEEVVNRPLAPNNEIVLFLYKYDEEDSKDEFDIKRNKLRHILKGLKISLTYEDLYHNKFLFCRELKGLFE
jgi:hypothetical protein